MEQALTHLGNEGWQSNKNASKGSGGKARMSDEKEQDPRFTTGQPNQDEIEKRLEDIKRAVTHGASEAQERLKRAVSRAGTYLQKVQTPQTPATKPTYQPTSIEEHRLRQLANNWSNENWRVTRDLGSQMEIMAWSTDEVWELNVETRWESRNLEVVTEPYRGTAPGLPRPVLPIWDYELPAIVGLKAPETRTRVGGLNEIVSCASCNSTGHMLCSECTGRGWIVCPDCKGRTKKRCTTCRGRGYVADWAVKDKKPFFKRQAQNVTSSLGNRVSDVVDTIRQRGVPFPNPIDTDPASKGPTIPCPDCVNGEVNCTCGNGKRICPTCQGAKMTLCSNCSGTGKVVRHRDIVRRFDLRTQTHILGDCPIPHQQLYKANGDLIFNDEVSEPLYPEYPPDQVPEHIWATTIELVRVESRVHENAGIDTQALARPTLQVVELIRIPYTHLQYRYGNQEYELYIYDSEGKEKFYADRYPARWDGIERLFKAITTDVMPSTQPGQGQQAPKQPPVAQPKQPVSDNGRQQSEYEGYEGYGYRGSANRPPDSPSEAD